MPTETTTTVRIIQIGQEPREMNVPVGTTIASLAGELGIPGAESMSALDQGMRALGPNDVIGEDTIAVNFVYKLAGA